MAYKRSNSPRHIDLMKDIMKLVAEPKSINNQKNSNVTYYRQPGKEHNHDFCDACREGGDIVCCDRCPRSYHITCHIPPLTKLPDGEWLCRKCFINNKEPMYEVPLNNYDKTESDDDSSCPYDFMSKDRFEVDMLPSVVQKIIGESNSPKCMIFTDIKSVMKHKFDLQTPRFLPGLKSIFKMPLVRKYNGKQTIRRQLDKFKFLRKDEKCCLCKKGVLKGRLVQCDFCNRLYHLDCLDPPIRDWDHNMKWLCPEHNTFYAYPRFFKDDQLYSDCITIKRLRCQMSSPIVNRLVSIPNSVDNVYKKSNDNNIPTEPFTTASLQILCDIATFELKSMTPDISIDNNDADVINDISIKFIALQRLYQLQKSYLSIPTKPLAYLSCTNPPNITTCVQKLEFTIGTSSECDLCLLNYINCENVSDVHATILFDEKLGDFSIKNHSKYGIIVNNISYFGNYQPKDLTNKKLNKINSQIKRHINKRRKLMRKQPIFSINETNNGKFSLKYNTNKQNSLLDYRSLSKNYMNMLSNTTHNYSNVQCSCSKRLIPKDGYPGLAFLCSGSTVSFGCIKFNFTYDRYVRSVSIEPLSTKKSLTFKEEMKESEIDLQNNEKLTFSHKDVSDNNNRYEKKKSDTSSLKNLPNRPTDFNISIEQTNLNHKKYSISENNLIKNIKPKLNGLINNNGHEEKTLDSMSNSTMTNLTMDWVHTNGINNQSKSYFAHDLIQEVEIDATECSNETIGIQQIEEEIVYDMDYTESNNSAMENVNENNAQNWIIEEILEDGVSCNGFEIGNEQDSVDQLSDSNVLKTSILEYSVSECNSRDYKTENVYHPTSSLYNEPIIISDDDDV
ncbi:uncharacterized protein LOC126907566 isoform X2 [Daktulosphaira vitifoliae]|uniref:uncharacterized protein LOC126907566 isoform X2 n=1 Tax=Daktulosphaira vitifoliae TaxID=58002 RepID=UPI0021A9F463|nr:uncharacterized protein LOC126907566 isoform X2 [Daktulosphaira vitifoliae]